MLNPNETNVAQHYNHNGFEYESVRLQEYSPVEFAMTARYFNRWIPEQSTVVDIELSRSLCRITCPTWLFAVPDRHFAETVRHNLCQTQSSQSRATSSQCPASFCNSGRGVETAIADAVFLGPLYHLCSLEERQNAMREAARMLKPDGLLFAAGINRLVYFRDLFQEPTRGSCRSSKLPSAITGWKC